MPRRKSDKIRLTFFTIILFAQICSVVIASKRTTPAQSFNIEKIAVLENKIERLDELRQADVAVIQLLRLDMEKRTTRLEAQMETTNWLLGSVLLGVGGLVMNLVWQILNGARERREGLH